MCHMQEANWFFKMPKTRCSYKDLHIHWQLDPLYVCVCVFILWWAMEVSPATAYCCVPLVLTGREGLWDRSGDSGLSEYSRCCQSFLLHTSHFLGHYACCTHSYINRWTIKKKSIMKPGTVEGIDIFNNWKWNIYEIRIFTASKPKEK